MTILLRYAAAYQIRLKNQLVCVIRHTREIIIKIRPQPRKHTQAHSPILFLDCEFEQSKINGMVLCVKCVASEFGLEKSVSLF